MHDTPPKSGADHPGAGPAVSVLMPVYNARRYVAAAIDSILAQSFTDFEFIIVDDGSTDGTAPILDDYAARERRIRLVRRPNTGIVGALNDGLAVARAPLVARMDADDIALPQRLARQMEYLASHPRCVAVGCQTLTIDPEGCPVSVQLWSEDHAEIERCVLKGAGSALPHPTVVMRRDAVTKVGGYRPETQWAEDVDLYLRLGEVGELANVPEVLLHYRQHLASANVVHRREQARIMVEIRRQTYARRGLGAPPEEQGGTADEPEVSNTRAIREGWIRAAAAHAYYATARKHARINLGQHPFSARAWFLMAYALTGPCGPALAAWRRKRRVG